MYNKITKWVKNKLFKPSIYDVIRGTKEFRNEYEYHLCDDKHVKLEFKFDSLSINLNDAHNLTFKASCHHNQERDKSTSYMIKVTFSSYTLNGVVIEHKYEITNCDSWDLLNTRINEIVDCIYTIPKIDLFKPLPLNYCIKELINKLWMREAGDLSSIINLRRVVFDRDERAIQFTPLFSDYDNKYKKDKPDIVVIADYRKDKRDGVFNSKIDTYHNITDLKLKVYCSHIGNGEKTEMTGLELLKLVNSYYFHITYEYVYFMLIHLVYMGRSLPHPYHLEKHYESLMYKLNGNTGGHL